jgi:uncharacterized membrane protein (UPF0127 family)
MDSELNTHVAKTFLDRLVGLAFSSSPRAMALLLPHCRSVHTFGMRFPLDLYWLDARGEVVRVDRGVPPWRIVRCARARCVIEVPVLTR